MRVGDVMDANIVIIYNIRCLTIDAAGLADILLALFRFL